MAWDGACPPEAPNSATGGSVAASETGFSPSRDIGTRRRCLPLTAERPKRHGHARLAHPSTLCRVVAGYHPPHSSQVSHQRATLKPSTLGESGWASRVARASQMHTKCPGTRFGHFGAARETSPGRIATPRGKRRPMAHGGGCGILVCILRSLGRALYGSGRGRVPFRPALLEGWYPANATPSVSPTRKPRVTNR